MSQSPMHTGDRASETGSLDRDLVEQAENIDKGLTAMPIDVAAASVARWKGALSSLKIDGGDRIVAGLDNLVASLSGGTPDGAKIATILAKLGQDVGTVASSQKGVVSTGLQRLSKSLTGAASQLTGGRTMTH